MFLKRFFNRAEVEKKCPFVLGVNHPRNKEQPRQLVQKHAPYLEAKEVQEVFCLIQTGGHHPESQPLD